MARCDRRRIASPHQIFNRSLQNARPPNESHYVVLDQYLPPREALGDDSCHRKLTQRRGRIIPIISTGNYALRIEAAADIRIVQARREDELFVILFP